MSGWIHIYLDVLAFVFGAVIGSFLNVCVHRMPRGESIVHPPSHCPKCNTALAWYDNIPLVSWLVLMGRCRKCDTWISPRYFIVELITAIVFLAIWLEFEGAVIPVYWLLAGGLIASTFIDFEHYIIPNELTYGGVVIGFVCSAGFPVVHYTDSRWVAMRESLLGIVVGAAMLWLIIEAGKLMFGRLKLRLPEPATVVIEREQIKVADDELKYEEVFSRDSDRIWLRASTIQIGDTTFENADVQVSELAVTVEGHDYPLEQNAPVTCVTDNLVIPREAMGMGDLKFMAAIGAFLGWKATVFILMVSSLLGSVVGLALFVLRLREWQGRIPYGPYIAAGALVWMFGGRDWVARYVEFLYR